MSIEWTIGIFVTTFFSIFTLMGGLIVRDRQITKTIHDGDSETHERIDKIREDYVRNDELSKHMQNVSDNVQNLILELRVTNERIDKVLTGNKK